MKNRWDADTCTSRHLLVIFTLALTCHIMHNFTAAWRGGNNFARNLIHNATHRATYSVFSVGKARYRWILPTANFSLFDTLTPHWDPCRCVPHAHCYCSSPAFCNIEIELQISKNVTLLIAFILQMRMLKCLHICVRFHSFPYKNNIILHTKWIYTFKSIVYIR